MAVTKFKSIKPYASSEDLQAAGELICQYIIDHPEVLDEPDDEDDTISSSVSSPLKSSLTAEECLQLVFNNCKHSIGPMPRSVLASILFHVHETMVIHGVLPPSRVNISTGG